MLAVVMVSCATGKWEAVDDATARRSPTTKPRFRKYLEVDATADCSIPIARRGRLMEAMFRKEDHQPASESPTPAVWTRPARWPESNGADRTIPAFDPCPMVRQPIPKEINEHMTPDMLPVVRELSVHLSVAVNLARRNQAARAVGDALGPRWAQPADRSVRGAVVALLACYATGAVGPAKRP